MDSDVSKSFVLLRLGRRRLALPASVVEELAPALRLHLFPHRSPSVSGVIVRRGRILPVLDVAPLLGEQNSTGQHFYLVARCRIGPATDVCAIPVDAECELASGDLEPAVDAPPFVAGRLQVHGGPLDVLDLDRLLDFSMARPHRSLAAEARP